MTQDKHDQIVRRMVESAGHTTQSLGVGRVLGQIYAYLYFSPTPLSLNDLTEGLGISKGSASMCVRQLEQWEALEKIWVKGDRKDYYRARDTFGKMIKNAFLDLVGKRMESSFDLLEQIGGELDEEQTNGTLSEQDVFMRDRIERMRAFQGKAQGLWNSVLLKMLLK